MRCSICLEEMDHPENRVFSCPNKAQTWHTREYRKLKQEFDSLEYSSFGTDAWRTARRGQLASQMEKMKS